MKFNKDPKIGQVGRKSEDKLAKSLGAKVTPASGAMSSAKGDMVHRDFLIEAKSTVNKSMSLKFEWLEKVTQEALETGKTPALSIRFTDSDGKAVRSGDWVAVPRTIYEEFVGD